jgi:hypothetical protein
MRANLAYPISGTLNVRDVIRTYIRLERLTNFNPLDEDDVDDEEAFEVLDAAATGKKRAVFAEHLEFKTTLTAGATPTLKLSAVAGSFRVTNATVGALARRSDAHSLIIAFAQDPGLRDKEFKRAALQRDTMLKSGVVRGPRTETALAQGNAVARNRVVMELARLRNLRDDEQEGAKFLGRQLLRFLRPPDESGG